jgi:arylsulfatase A-like enzyme
MVNEIDTWVITLNDRLKTRGEWDNTLFVFTSDHGEMLGAHGTYGNGDFYEEAVRVPLIMSLPNGADKGTRVTVPISHLDLHSTILDYLGAPASWDTSDGASLRRHIERSSYNPYNDETAVVAEWDYDPDDAKVRTEEPAFMILKVSYKLILPRVASADIIDMMYIIENDPYV